MKFPDVASSVSSKSFIKLKDKEFIKGVLRGEPYIFRIHWLENRGVLCSGKEKCEACKGGNQSKFRFRINLVVTENGAQIAKIFEGNSYVYNDLRSLAEAGHELEKVVIQITRKGEKLDTKFNIVPVPKGELKPEQEKHIAQVKLLDLVNPQDEQESTDDNDEVPF